MTWVPQLHVSPPPMETFKEKVKGSKVMISCQRNDLLEAESKV